jgi:transposase-like protein
MAIRQPSCPRCQDNLFVRAEQVISGRRVTQAFYCGRCNDEWQVENSPPDAGERRQAERRKQRVDALTKTLDKTPAPVSLTAKADRRSAKRNRLP